MAKSPLMCIPQRSHAAGQSSEGTELVSVNTYVVLEVGNTGDLGVQLDTNAVANPSCAWRIACILIIAFFAVTFGVIAAVDWGLDINNCVGALDSYDTRFKRLAHRMFCSRFVETEKYFFGMLSCGLLSGLGAALLARGGQRQHFNSIIILIVNGSQAWLSIIPWFLYFRVVNVAHFKFYRDLLHFGSLVSGIYVYFTLQRLYLDRIDFLVQTLRGNEQHTRRPRRVLAVLKVIFAVFAVVYITVRYYVAEMPFPSLNHTPEYTAYCVFVCCCVLFCCCYIYLSFATVVALARPVVQAVRAIQVAAVGGGSPWTRTTVRAPVMLSVQAVTVAASLYMSGNALGAMLHNAASSYDETQSIIPAMDIVCNTFSVLLTSGAVDLFLDWSKLTSTLTQTVRAYESFFVGRILEDRGVACVVSWPGIYAKLWDTLVHKGKVSRISAGVVFLPAGTARFGTHVEDPDCLGQCYCNPMYGEPKEWGCGWFAVWMANVKLAVSRGQTLIVVFFEDCVGKGKVSSWDACREDAIKRHELGQKKKEFLNSLPETTRQQLCRLPNTPRDDVTERPGSKQDDERERLFLESLSEEERLFLEHHRGLGNSQKAEVAWLDRMGYQYIQMSVREFQHRYL